MSRRREILYAADIAKMRGTSPRAARAYLAALERKHGSNVVGRDGEKLFIARRALARFMPGIAESSADADPQFRKMFRQVQAIAHVVYDVVNGMNDLRERQETLASQLDRLERLPGEDSGGAIHSVSPCVVERLDERDGSGGGSRRKFAAQRVGGHDRVDGRPRAGVPECPPPPSPLSAASSAHLRAAAPRLSATELTSPEDPADDPTTSCAESDAGAEANRASRETLEEELARLIREQREDQRQDRIGLQGTVLGKCLRGIGIRVDDWTPRKRASHQDDP
jgi:hypothetical protein